MAGRLANKRCLIVGGTNGLGFAAAGRFLEEGASLVIAGLPEPNPEAALEALRQSAAPESRAWASAVDATSAEQVGQLFERAVTLLGGLDVLYHVAGGSGRRHGDGPLHECSDAGWQATLGVNRNSAFLPKRPAVGHFLPERP